MDVTDNANLQIMETLKQRQKALRSEERELQARTRALYTAPAVEGNNAKDLARSLRSFLPPSHIPGNVGALNSVCWPQWYQADFELGLNPVMGPALKAQSFFQVTQEAAFILMSISRDAESATNSGALAPLEIEIRDRQSSRALMNQPIPLQNIGFKSLPTILPTPYFIYPSAFIDITMTSFQTVNVATAGSGRHQLSFFGYRIRIEDFEKVLSTIFK